MSSVGGARKGAGRPRLAVSEAYLRAEAARDGGRELVPRVVALLKKILDQAEESARPIRYLPALREVLDRYGHARLTAHEIRTPAEQDAMIERYFLLKQDRAGSNGSLTENS